MGLSTGRHRRRAGRLRPRLLDHDERPSRADLHVLRRGQEAELDHDVPLPPHGAVRVPAAPAPDPAALANAADALAAAERPVVIADFAARPPHGWAHVIAIAETLGAPVWDCNSRLNFPSNHPLNLSMAPKECYDAADVVLALDIADFEGPTHVRDIATRTVVNMVPETATWIDIGFHEGAGSHEC